MTVFTSGEWHVKAGREDEFLRLWNGFGSWDFAESRGAGAVLLRDRDDPRHFRSFGHWPDEASVARWQSSDAFTRWLQDIRETIDQMDSFVMDVAETVGTNADVPVGAASR